MKIFVETLKKIDNSWILEELLTEEILSKSISEAKSRVIKLQSERVGKRIRVHKCTHDENSKVRKPCVII